jgi:hypothetical protein
MLEQTEQTSPPFFKGMFVVWPLTDIDADQSRWHQDIKPQNLLVTSGSTKSSYECPIKLADLGISHFSKALASHRDSTAREAHGTRTYGRHRRHPLKMKLSDIDSYRSTRVLQIKPAH